MQFFLASILFTSFSSDLVGPVIKIVGTTTELLHSECIYYAENILRIIQLVEMH